MAVSLAPLPLWPQGSADLHARRRITSTWTTASTEAKRRNTSQISDIARRWERLWRSKSGLTYRQPVNGNSYSEEDFKPLKTPHAPALLIPLPSCERSDGDCPPDYTATDALAYRRINPDALHVYAIGAGDWDGRAQDQKCSRDERVDVDFEETSNIRTCANKKSKKAARAAQMSKWADDDGDEKKDGGDGAGEDKKDGDAGGDGGAGAGGDGGDPPGGGDGGGGGDDDDWWDTSKKKNNKKNKKKNPWEQFEEEEEKREDVAKKAEEEEEAAKKATEEPTPDPMDDFGSFAQVGKRKKGKKGAMAEPEPPPPPPPPADPEALETVDLSAGATADANGDDDWGFSTQKKKGKKGKKGQADPVVPAVAPAPAAEPEMNFDNIDLNDDKNPPKLDLDFGLGPTDDKKGGSGFSFGGGWGGGWGGGGTSWGFNAADEDKKPKADETGWGFGTGSGAKDSKKKNGGFDFSFDALGADDNSGSTPAANKEEAPAIDDDPWTSLPKKDKKKGKKIADPEPEPVAPALESKKDEKEKDKKTGEDDFFGFTSATSKKEKEKEKKKKKSIWDDPEPEPVITPEPPPPPVEPPKEEKKEEEEDMWSFGTSAKDKKKKKKEAKAVVKEEEKVVEEPVTVVAPAIIEDPKPGPVDDFDTWGVSTSKKEKKKKKGAFDFGSLEPDPVPTIPEPVTTAPAAEPEEELFAASAWGDVGKKKDKKSKKGAIIEDVAPVDPTPPPPPPPPPEPVAEEKDQDWFGGWGSSAKKDKKGKKTKTLEPEVVALPPPVPPVEEEPNTFPDTVDEPRAEEEDAFTAAWTVGTKKKEKKKTSSKGITEIIDSPPGAAVLQPESVQEKSADDDPWNMYGNVGKKDKKKTSKKGIVDVTPALPELPAPPDPVIEEPTQNAALLDFDAPADDPDPWGFSTTTKKKGGKDKKTTSAKIVPVIEPPKIEEAPLEKSKSKTSKSSKDNVDDILDLMQDTAPTAAQPDPLDDLKASVTKEEKKSKSTASPWGSLWGSNSKTAKTSKEKEKEAKEAKERERKDAEAAAAAAAEAQRIADEEAFAAALGDDADDILDPMEDLAPPPPPPTTGAKKSSKDKDGNKKSGDKSAKDSKSSSKKIEAKEEPVEVLPAVEEPLLDEEQDPLDALLAEPKAAKGGKAPKAEGWGFWGASLRSAAVPDPAPAPTPAAFPASGAKKGSITAAADARKEIAAERGSLASTRAALTDDLVLDVEPATSPPSTKTTKTTVSSKSKPIGSKTGASSSTVQERIKALQAEKEAIAAAVSPSAARRGSKDASHSRAIESLVVDIPELDPEPLPIAEEKEKKSSKKTGSSSAAATKLKSSSSKKESKTKAIPVEVAPADPPVSPLPGGFPTDDFLDFSSATPLSPPKKSSSKDKEKKSSSKSQRRSVVPDEIERDLLIDEEDSKLPTPPPEKPIKDDPKAHKKERPRIVRDQQQSSWGFWGTAPPPKATPKKTKGDITPPEDKPEKSSLQRSQSARKPKESEREVLDKGSKSSGSDKERKASKSQQNSSRGMSFFGLGASTPSRSKSTRERTSRRQSAAIDDSGLISPPPEDAKPREMSSKAAKVMGVQRGKSSRQRTESRKVPDPYPLDDDDDLVMVDRPDDAAKDVPQFDVPSYDRDERKSRKSRRQSTMMSGALGERDDEAAGDAPRAMDDFDMAERPPLVRRSTSTAKKGGLMGGIFSAFSTKPAPDRRQSRAYESEDNATRRKRSSGNADDAAKRLRREDRRVNRSRKASDAEGLTDAAPMTDAEAIEAKEARRAERRARREREAAEEDARLARSREKEEARKVKAREERDRAAREEELREARRQEERRARRAEREARRAEEDRLAREDEAQAAERRERRRQRERARAEEAAAPRPVSDRRRSYADAPEDSEARRIRREERRVRRSVDPSMDRDAEQDRPRASRRRSEYPAPVDDFYDRRYGEPNPAANGGVPPANGRAYLKPSGGKDKTSSWVASVNDDPPPPPPVEGTIIDAPMHFAEDLAPDAPPFEETTAREMRQRRRRERGSARGVDPYADEESDRYQRRRDRRDWEGGEQTVQTQQRSSDGSDRQRRQSYAGGPVKAYGEYSNGGVKTFDGRPTAAKRGSWFQKITMGF